MRVLVFTIKIVYMAENQVATEAFGSDQVVAVLSTTDSWADFFSIHGMLNPSTGEPEKKVVGKEFIEFIKFLSPVDNLSEVAEYASELPSQRIEQLWRIFSLINYSEISGGSYHPTEKMAALFIGEIIKVTNDAERKLLAEDRQLLKQAAADLSWCLFSIEPNGKNGPVGLGNNRANPLMKESGINEAWSVLKPADSAKTVIYVQKGRKEPEKIGRACFSVIPINPEGIEGRRLASALRKPADQASTQQAIELTTYEVEYRRYEDGGEKEAAVTFRLKERMEPNRKIEKSVSVAL